MKYLSIFIGSLIILIFIVFLELGRFYDGESHIVFCDVGQGDAVFIRTADRKDILIDGGPDQSVLSCLEENLPFWDKEIDVILLTHPHADHLTGITHVLERYKVNHFFDSGVEGNTDIYRKLIDDIAEENLSAKELRAGDRLVLGKNSFLKAYWPDAGWLDTWKQTEFDPNDSSLVLHFQFGSFDVLFTGDTESHILDSLNLPDVEVLKIPHQGSKGALTGTTIYKTKPEVGIIFVGKNNYGHPSHETIDLLNSNNVKTYRTDLNGAVKISSDGESWTVKMTDKN